MAISVTTRTGKGSPLSTAEMDTNLTNLAVSATESAEGNIEIATQAETEALTDATKAVVPAYLGAGIDAYTDSLSNSFTANGYATLPGGLIIQWGTHDCLGVNGQDTPSTLNFPIAFPTACFSVVMTINDQAGRDGSAGIEVTSFNTSSAAILAGADHGPNCPWIAVGY